MNLLIWIIAGGSIGAFTALLIKLSRPAQPIELALNVVTGAVGALLGGCLLAPVFGTGTIDVQHYSNGKLLVALVGASALLIIVNGFGRLAKN